MTTPNDYDASDGWDDEEGAECCPHCGQVWHMESGAKGPVFTNDGREYEYYTESDPGDGPFFCADCYADLDANRKRQQHRTLGEF